MAVTLPLDLYKAGQLKDAVVATLDVVRKNPGETLARWFLAELLCFSGDLQRADKQLDTLSQQDASLAVSVAAFRQLIRAEQHRQDFFNQGRLPEFAEPPDARIKLMLQASIAIRDGKDAEAVKLLTEADGMRPRLKGVCDDKPFDDLRDLDDLTASVFEVLAANGTYYWVPMERVELLEFRPHERPRDVLWRKVRMVVRGGIEREVHMPGLYPGAHLEKDEHLALGMGTDWRGVEGQPIRGAGHRQYLVGDEARTFLELKTIKIEHST